MLDNGGEAHEYVYPMYGELSNVVDSYLKNPEYIDQIISWLGDKPSQYPNAMLEEIRQRKAQFEHLPKGEKSNYSRLDTLEDKILRQIGNNKVQ